MCNEALEVDPWSLCHIPNYLKTQKMCLKVVKDETSSLAFVPNLFVARRPIIMLNTKLREEAKNEFEKDFFNLMNKSIFENTMKISEECHEAKVLKMVILQTLG